MRLWLNTESLYILSLSEDIQTIVLGPEVHSSLGKTGGTEALQALLCVLCIQLVSNDNSCCLPACYCFWLWFLGFWRIWNLYCLKQLWTFWGHWQWQSAEHARNGFSASHRSASSRGPTASRDKETRKITLTELLQGTRLSALEVIHLIVSPVLWQSFSVNLFCRCPDKGSEKLNSHPNARNSWFWKADQMNCAQALCYNTKRCHAGSVPYLNKSQCHGIPWWTSG